MSTPLRISGSPLRPTTRRSAAPRPDSLCVATSLPVSSRPQAAALTNSEGLAPTCACQSPLPILSRMSASRVAASGMRSSASARHISATPSCEDSANSCSSPCTSPARPAAACARASACASRRASACVAAHCASSRRACASSAGSTSGSARRVAAVMASRSGVRVRPGVKAAKVMGWSGVGGFMARCWVAGRIPASPSSARIDADVNDHRRLSSRACRGQTAGAGWLEQQRRRALGRGRCIELRIDRAPRRRHPRHWRRVGLRHAQGRTRGQAGGEDLRRRDRAAVPERPARPAPSGQLASNGGKTLVNGLPTTAKEAASINGDNFEDMAIWFKTLMQDTAGQDRGRGKACPATRPWRCPAAEACRPITPSPPACPASGCRSRWRRGVRAAGCTARPRRG